MTMSNSQDSVSDNVTGSGLTQELTQELSQKLAKAPKLNRLFRLQFEKAQDCHVLLFPEGMIKLNPSAAEILTRVDGVKTQQEICDELRVAFPDAPEDLDEDVKAFLLHAAEKKWVVYVE